MKPVFFNLLIISVLLIFTACSSGDKKENDDVNGKNEHLEKAPPPPVSYAPGTAGIEGIIKTLDMESSPKKCTVTIKKINGYGSATPALPGGGDVEVVLPDNILKAETAENLKTGEQCSMIIRIVEKMGSSKISNWICVKIN